MEPIKIIATEEHMWTPAIRERLLADIAVQGGGMPPPIIEALGECGESRLQHMAAIGVDMQILSVHTPGTQNMEPGDAVALSREANDALSELCRQHPERYGAFATLPTADPQAACEELERAVGTLGLHGAMLYGRTGEKFLDHADFVGIFDTAARLDVPLYIHPRRPLDAVANAYYEQGLSPLVGRVLSNFAWGWHVEAAVNAIRLVLAGTFERTPAPQVILGHWGEMVPFFLERLDEVFNLFSPPRGFGETFASHFYVSPAGIWSYPMLQHAVAELGADRVLFSVDYPFIQPADGGARRFVEEAPISLGDKHKIGHLNATRLLKLDRGR